VLKHVLFVVAAGAALGQPNLSSPSPDWTSNLKVFPKSFVIDHDGDTYLLGIATSGFAPTNPVYGSGPARTAVIKLDASGSLIWSTCIGRGEGNGIAIDSTNNVYIAGSTDGNSFPTTP